MADAQSNELQQAVNELAKSPSIDSKRIGEAGLPSPNFERYERVAQLASFTDLEALLSHPNPVVRGYAAKGILQKDPKQATALYPLLADSISVKTVNGCIGGSDTVGNIVALALAWNADPAVMPDILARAKQDPHVPKEVYETLSGYFANRQGQEKALRLTSDYLKAHGKDPSAYTIYVMETTRERTTFGKERLWTKVYVDLKSKASSVGRPARGTLKLDLKTEEIVIMSPLP